MPDDAPIPIDLDDPATVARVDAEARRTIETAFNQALAELPKPLQAPVLLTSAIAGVMAVAARSNDPGRALLGAIGILVHHGQAHGWLDAPPPNASTVLVFPPAEMPTLATAAAGSMH